MIALIRESVDAGSVCSGRWRVSCYSVALCEPALHGAQESSGFRDHAESIAFGLSELHLLLEPSAGGFLN